MGRKSKYSYETKIAAVQAYENNEGSIKVVSDKFNIGKSTLIGWLMIFKSQGAYGLKETFANQKWDNSLKLSAVQDYVSNNCSISEVCKKYNISSTSLFRRWLKVYNSHSEFKNTVTGDKYTMIKARKTTFNERIEIVQFCIANCKNYYLTMEKYSVSYQQIYLWVRKYEQNGIDGLFDRRGKAKSESDITDTDRLKAQNKLLQAEKEHLEMEVNVLKKLAEVERRRH